MRLGKFLSFLGVIAALVCGLSACSGDPYAKQVLKERKRLSAVKRMLEPGLSKDEVLRVAGAPNHVMKNTHGQESLTYETDVTVADKGKDVLIGFRVLIVLDKVFGIEDIISYSH